MEPVIRCKSLSFLTNLQPFTHTPLSQPNKTNLAIRFIFKHWFLPLVILTLGASFVLLRFFLKRKIHRPIPSPAPPPPQARPPQERREEANQLPPTPIRPPPPPVLPENPPTQIIEAAPPPTPIRPPHLPALPESPPTQIIEAAPRPTPAALSREQQFLVGAFSEVLPPDCATALITNGFPVPHKIHMLEDTPRRKVFQLEYPSPLDGTVTTRTDIQGLAGCFLHMPQGIMRVTLNLRDKKIEFSGALFSAMQEKERCLTAIHECVQELKPIARRAAMLVVQKLPNQLQLHFSALSFNKNGSIGFDFTVDGSLNHLLRALKVCVDFSLPKENFLRLFAPDCIAWQ